MSYSNPRTHAEVENWPMGGSRRGVAVFSVESDPKRGERGVRVTTTEDGRTNNPKKLTYTRKVRIVDDDDGKTYFAELTSYGFVTIMQGNAQFAAETIHKDDPRYVDVLALFGDPS